MRIFYTVLLYLFYPVIYFKIRKRFGKDYIKLRKTPEIKGNFDFIVHAASVGEQVLIVPVVKAIVEKGYKVLLTCATDTGFNKAKDNFGSEHNVGICYFPFDFPFSLKTFFSNVKAKSIIFVETELWPNAIHYAYKKGLKLFLVNGRISDKSFPLYKKFRFYLKELFNCFEKVIVRSEEDFEKFLNIGCEREKLKICGNLKLLNKPLKKVDILINSDLPIVVFGSTRDYEEELIVESLKDLIGTKINPIIVPRHVQRTEEIVDVVKKSGFNPVLSDGKNTFVLKKGDILIVNETGKLISYYAAAELCYVGGSLVDFGGQNFVEPLFLGKPVVTGRFLSNFKDLKEILYNYFTIVENGNELHFFVENFFENKQYFIKKAKDAVEFLEKSKQSLECILEEILC